MSIFLRKNRIPVKWDSFKPNPDKVYKFWFYDIQREKVSNLRPDRYVVYTVRALEDYTDVHPSMFEQEIVDLHISKASLEYAFDNYPKGREFDELSVGKRNDAYVEFSRDSSRTITIHKIEIRDHVSDI